MPGDLYTSLVSSVLFPLHERLKGHTTVRVRKALEASQWWPQAQLRALSMERLQRLLEHAEREVPYYQRIFAETGMTAGQFRNLEDLQRLPFLTKERIRVHSEALRSRTAGTLARCNTGGSTGEPLIFYIGNDRVSHDVAAKWRATRWWNVDIGDPETVVWGSPIELGSQDLLRAVRDRLLRTELLPAFEMSEKMLDRFIRSIRARRPKMLFGYPSALSFIARYAADNRLPMDDLGIKVVFVTSERLYDEQRAIIAGVFNCPVANGYGGRDAGFIAHECPHGGMHITAEDIIVEIIDAGGRTLPPGAAGEVVITHLSTADYPFIRYRTGDVAVLDDSVCACGRGLPLLREIQGRTTDFLVASDGTVMHGLAVIYVIRDLAGVEQFKVIQEDRLHVRVLLVTGAAFRETDAELIRAGIRQRLGEDVTVTIERVSDIPAERSGKFRYVVSHVSAASHATPAGEQRG